MPTGYTANLSGNFPDFIRKCATTFVPGAGDSLPTHVFVDPFYEEAVEKARYALSTAERADYVRLAAQAHLRNVSTHAERVAEQRKVRAQYDFMLDEARRWTPPTEDHVALKDFMVRQLEMGREFDTYPLPAPKRIPAEEWFTLHVMDLVQALEHAEARLVQEAQRAAESTQWIEQLKGSLK